LDLSGKFEFTLLALLELATADRGDRLLQTRQIAAKQNIPKLI